MPVSSQILVTHDSEASKVAFDDLERLLKDNPKGLAAFRKRFSRFQDLLIYKRSSALRAGHCTAGFEPTRQFLKFLAALRADKRKFDPAINSSCHKSC
jgi:hypothetical protein